MEPVVTEYGKTLVEAGARAVAAEDRCRDGTLIPDKYDNIRSWAEETTRAWNQEPLLME